MGGCGGVVYFVGWFARKGSKGPAKFCPEHRAVGSSLVVLGESRVPRRWVGDSGNAGKSFCSSAGGKTASEVPQGAVEDDGQTGGGNGAGVQERGGDGGKAAGEALTLSATDPWPPKRLWPGPLPLGWLHWRRNPRSSGAAGSPWGTARVGGKLTVGPKSSSWAAGCRSPKWGEDRERKEGEAVVEGDEHDPCCKGLSGGGMCCQGLLVLAGIE